MKKIFASMDGNQATAHVAYMFTEVAGIYPITPSSNMAEFVDAWTTQGRKNLFNAPVKVVEMQSEAGAAGAVHGALQGGTLSTTFTASQGLLLMIPNLYKMQGELLPAVIHVSSRAVGSRAISIFGDHSDVYACRQTGIAMLSSHSVQECMDLAGVAHLSALKGHVPFMHFFDGFRTSHEIQKIEVMDQEFMDSLVDRDSIDSFRSRMLNPHSNPIAHGGVENEDIFFQSKEAQNEHYNKVIEIVNNYMCKVSEHTGRDYAPFTYYGPSDAVNIIVAMGSITETIKEVIDNEAKKGNKIGLIKVHLFRPFSMKYLLKVLPKTVKNVTVIDRSTEIGAREPLYLDVYNALSGIDQIECILGGRYALAGKDTQPKHIMAIYDNIESSNPIDDFSVGINDDVTMKSLKIDEEYFVESDYTSCLFYGLGSDGTVSANKNSIKIIGDHTDLYSQAYFAYDSKKAGGATRSNLRFGPSPIKSTYFIREADFISCSLDTYLLKYDMLRNLKVGGTFLLATTFSADKIEKHLPNRVKVQLAQKNAKFYIIDAVGIASKIGMGRRTNTILQSSFFALNEQIMPYEEALNYMKEAAKKSYSKKGDDIVKLNYIAIDKGKEGITQIEVKPEWANLESKFARRTIKNDYFDNHVSAINALEGDDLPVSAFTKNCLLDGSMPSNIAFNEKRTIATFVPKWHADNCIQCGFCSFVCPHATIRTFLLTDTEVKNAPLKFDTIKPVGQGEVADLNYCVSISQDNCVGCGLCVVECPGKAGNKALSMEDINTQLPLVPIADYLYKEIEYKSNYFSTDTIKGSQFLMPYFEVSGACAGCGETPYYKLVSQLFGRDMLVANATGCSSVYSGSTPSTPFVKDKNGEGIAWGNSLFEDNAEYGFGMRVAQNYKDYRIVDELTRHLDSLSADEQEIVKGYLSVKGNRDLERQYVVQLETIIDEKIEILKEFKRDLVSKSVWIVGGDGWAYDIGYGGLDHVLSNDLDVNILVLDTEVYSNTGGQSSKSSQAASIAKFAAGGKKLAKKDLGQIAMAYGHVYVASIAMGANRMQTLKAIKEAEAYKGPSLILAYSPCAEHGITGGLMNHQKVQKNAVECGYWPLYRFNPNEDKPLTIDYTTPDFSKFEQFLSNETRFSMLPKVNSEHAEDLLDKTCKDAQKRWKRLENLSR